MRKSLSTDSVQTSIGHVKIDPDSARRLELTLEAYAANSAVPLSGAPAWVPSAEDARRLQRDASDSIRAEALVEALNMGAWDTNVVDEAIGDVMLHLSSAKMFARLSKGHSPRPYIKEVIHRAVRRIVYRRWKFQILAPTLPDGLAAPDPGPALLAELHDAATHCGRILEPMKGTTLEDESIASKSYVRKHRDRKKKWAAIAKVFPHTTFKPRRRNKKLKSKP